MPEPLPETGVLANHSSDFMLRITADISRPPSITELSLRKYEIQGPNKTYKYGVIYGVF